MLPVLSSPPSSSMLLSACVAVSVGVAVTLRATPVAVLMKACADAAVAKTVLAVDCSAATFVAAVAKTVAVIATEPAAYVVSTRSRGTPNSVAQLVR